MILYVTTFYVIQALHKKSRQSLKNSPECPFDCKLYFSFIKKSPKYKIVDMAAPPTELNIKGIYVIKYSFYGQIIDPLCK